MPQITPEQVKAFRELTDAQAKKALGYMSPADKGMLLTALQSAPSVKASQKLQGVDDPTREMGAAQLGDARSAAFLSGILEPFSARGPEDAQGNAPWKIPDIIRGAVGSALSSQSPKQQIDALGSLPSAIKERGKSLTSADSLEQAKMGGQLTLEVPPILAGAEAVIKGGAGMMPSASRAGAKFNAIDAAAGKIPINPAAADAVAARAKELSTTGATLPKVFRDFLKERNANPSMNYSKGRDFASNAGRLSATESQMSNPVMKMEVGKFYDALKTANREAAVKAGMGDVYDSAIKEFRRASTIADKQAIAKKWAIGILATGAAGTAIKKVFFDK